MRFLADEGVDGLIVDGISNMEKAQTVARAIREHEAEGQSGSESETPLAGH